MQKILKLICYKHHWKNYLQRLNLNLKLFNRLFNNWHLQGNPIKFLVISSQFLSWGQINLFCLADSPLKKKEKVQQHLIARMTWTCYSFTITGKKPLFARRLIKNIYPPAMWCWHWILASAVACFTVKQWKILLSILLYQIAV